MKFTILLLALAAVLAISNTTPLSKAARQNLIAGNIIAGDRLLARANVVKRAVANQIQTEDVSYRGANNVRIQAIRAIENPPFQRPQVRIVQGGIGWSNTTLRFTSSRGYGYNYTMEIWGR